MKRGEVRWSAPDAARPHHDNHAAINNYTP